VDAAVDCYGGFVTRGAPAELAPKLGPILHLVSGLRCPLLGLFGADDKNPTPDETAQLEAEVRKTGKPCEFHTYEGAGHAFFATERVSYRVEAANDGWERIWAWFGRYLMEG
jgi:carboxymethylenebutenolidase